jgi:hypothetical protein
MKIQNFSAFWDAFQASGEIPKILEHAQKSAKESVSKIDGSDLDKVVSITASVALSASVNILESYHGWLAKQFGE